MKYEIRKYTRRVQNGRRKSRRIVVVVVVRGGKKIRLHVITVMEETVGIRRIVFICIICRYYWLDCKTGEKRRAIRKLLLLLLRTDSCTRIYTECNVHYIAFIACVDAFALVSDHPINVVITIFASERYFIILFFFFLYRFARIAITAVVGLPILFVLIRV